MTIPTWHLDESGNYTCNDETEGLFAFLAALVGFDLVAFDLWIANFEPCAARDEMLERRTQAKQSRSNAALMTAHLEWLKLRRYAIEREDILLPPARIEIGVKKKRAQGTERSVKARRKKHDPINAKILDAVDKLRALNPKLTFVELGKRLAGREFEFGEADYLRQKISKLLKERSVKK